MHNFQIEKNCLPARMLLVWLLLILKLLSASCNDYQLDTIVCTSDQKTIIEIFVCECDEKQIWIDFDIIKSVSQWSVNIDRLSKL